MPTVKIFQGDCVEVMRDIGDGSIPLVVDSPSMTLPIHEAEAFFKINR